MADTIDINITPIVETIDLTITPNLTTININTLGGGGGAVTSVNTDTGAVIVDIQSVLDQTSRQWSKVVGDYTYLVQFFEGANTFTVEIDNNVTGSSSYVDFNENTWVNNITNALDSKSVVAQWAIDLGYQFNYQNIFGSNDFKILPRTSGSGDIASISLPNNLPTGDYIVPISVNGNLANADGQITIPISASGGSAISYYLNGGTAASVATYYQMSKTAVIGTGVDFSKAGNGLISQWLTDVADPNRLEIPAGNWNFEMYMSASSAGGTPAFYVELLKYNGATFTTIANSSAVPEAITSGTLIDLYLTSLAIPYTTLTVTDRLAVRVYIVNSTGGRTITMHTQDSHLCEIITNFAGGIAALNGLVANTQNFAVGTSGTDFAISSSTDTHTFNLPTASATNRGALSSANWSTFNNKQNALGFTPENVANKSISIVTDKNSDTKYPSVKSVNDWVTGIYQPILSDTNFGLFVNLLTDKSTPIDADSISLVDSVAANRAKKTTFANLKAFFKTYFDGLYSNKARTIFQGKTTLTGVTSNAQIFTMKVDAGLYASTDAFTLNMDIFKSVTVGVVTLRVYIGTTAGALTTQIGQLGFVIANVGAGFVRQYSLNSGNIESTVGGTTSLNTNYTNVNSAALSTALNPANDFWITVTANPSVITETIGVYSASIMPLK